MKDGFVQTRGDRLHYVEAGEGSPVLLVHAAFRSGEDFLSSEFGAGLARRHRVIAPDSLAHGRSAAPADPARYGARRRAGHLAAVLDRLGIERAHVVGYSMGGWMASALAAFHPERIASLAIGGWDVADGMYTAARAWGLPKITYDILAALVREQRPDLMGWITTRGEPGLAAAIEGMNDLAGLAEAVANLGAPLALWLGRGDVYHDANVRFSAATGARLFSLPGDHATLLEDHGAEAARAILGFLADCERATPPASSRIKP